jgi:hypothetical protein
MARRPRLHHELLLLALHDRKGTHAFGQMLGLGLGGAIFTELLLTERVRVARDARKPKRELVEVVDASATHDPAMDAALDKLSSAKRRASPSTTVSRIGGIKDLRHLIARDLCAMGILRERDDRVLLLFRRRIYPELDPGPERELIGRVRAALAGSGPVDERTAALVVLADATGVLAAIYDRKQRKAVSARVKELREGGAGGRATREAIAAAQAAMSAAMIAATVAAASS